jgi:hypothetical protein
MRLADRADSFLAEKFWGWPTQKVARIQRPKSDMGIASMPEGVSIELDGLFYASVDGTVSCKRIGQMQTQFVRSSISVQGRVYPVLVLKPSVSRCSRTVTTTFV